MEAEEIKHDLPILIGWVTYQYAKVSTHLHLLYPFNKHYHMQLKFKFIQLHMLKFVHFLMDHLVEGSYDFIETDTDSVYLGVAYDPEHEDMTKIVKPEMMESWRANEAKWFAKDKFSERTPGKFKVEVI